MGEEEKTRLPAATLAATEPAPWRGVTFFPERLCGRGEGGSFFPPRLSGAVRVFGGVSWLLSRAVSVSCPSLRSCCVRLAVGWPRGAVSPWGCRSAVPGCRCRGLSRSPGSARSRRRLASRCRGVAACRPAPVFARCAGSRVVSRCRFRFVRACRRVAPACAPWWRLAPLPPRRAPWPRSVAPPRLRGRAGARLRALVALAGLSRRVAGGVSLAAGRRALPPPRRVVRLSRCWPGGGGPPPLAGGGALGRPPALGAGGPAGRRSGCARSTTGFFRPALLALVTVFYEIYCKFRLIFFLFEIKYYCSSLFYPPVAPGAIRKATERSIRNVRFIQHF